MKCKDCGQYDALNWSKRGFCLRCWLKSDEPPVSNQQLEGMDAYYAYEDDHPCCQNCGERLTECMCDYPLEAN